MFTAVLFMIPPELERNHISSKKALEKWIMICSYGELFVSSKEDCSSCTLQGGWVTNTRLPARWTKPDKKHVILIQYTKGQDQWSKSEQETPQPVGLWVQLTWKGKHEIWGMMKMSYILICIIHLIGYNQISVHICHNSTIFKLYVFTVSKFHLHGQKVDGVLRYGSLSVLMIKRG